MLRFVLAIIIVAVAAFCAGFTGLNGSFVWDDISLLVLQPVYRNFDLRTIFLSPARQLAMPKFSVAGKAARNT